MPLIIPANTLLPSGYNIDNSCKFTRADSPYMHITPGGDGNLKIFTVSFWVKRGNLNGGTSGTDREVIFSNATNDQISFHNDDLCFLEDGSDRAITNMKFRDFSAWYHIVMAFDTNQSTDTNRHKVYVNGVQIDQSTGFSTMTYVAEDLEMGFGKGSEMMSVGRSEFDDNRHFNGYLSEFYYINGTMLDHTSFGEFDSDSPTIWKPKKFSGSFGTNGFYLDFEDSANLGNDANGGTDLTEVNLAAADQATDTPTNNFAVLNPLIEHFPTYVTTYSEGNLDATRSDTGSGLSTIMVTSGKWYAEFKLITLGSGKSVIGAVSYDLTAGVVSSGGENSSSNSGVCYRSDGKKRIDGGTAATYGDSFVANDIISIALNLDDGECTFYKNGTAQASGTALSGFSTASAFAIDCKGGGSTWKWSANFGNPSPSYTISSGNADANGYGNFEYSVPTNYYALCTKNLAEFGG